MSVVVDETQASIVFDHVVLPEASLGAHSNVSTSEPLDVSDVVVVVVVVVAVVVIVVVAVVAVVAAASATTTSGDGASKPAAVCRAKSSARFV